MLYLANKYSITTVKLRVSFRDVISLYTQISASQFSDRLHLRPQSTKGNVKSTSVVFWSNESPGLCWYTPDNLIRSSFYQKQILLHYERVILGVLLSEGFIYHGSCEFLMRSSCISLVLCVFGSIGHEIRWMLLLEDQNERNVFIQDTQTGKWL